MSVRIITGDCLEVMRTLPDQSVHCCVSSPPYWGLRCYGVDGQYGLEPTIGEYIAKMVAVFAEVKRVLRDDGTLWLNMGDSYFHVNESGPQGKNGQRATRTFTAQGAGGKANESSLKPKDLCGIPWRLAFALQQPQYTGQIKSEADRVWLAAIIDGEGCFFIHKRKAGERSYSKFTRADGSEADYKRTADTYGAGLEICNTHKAIIDRVQAIAGAGTVTTQGPQQNARRKQTIYRWRVAQNEAKRLAQELYPHLVAKQHQARLIFNCPSAGDAGAKAHQAMMDLHNGVATTVDYPRPPSMFEPGWFLRSDIIWKKSNPMPESVTDRPTKSHEYIFLLSKRASYYYDAEAIKETSVTDDARRPYGSPGANALDPRDKPQGNGKVRSPAGWKTGNGSHGSVHADGREQEISYNEIDTTRRNKRTVWTVPTHSFSEAHFATFPPALIEPCILAGCPIGGTVLDCFGGAGTTGLVADRLQRSAILIELNPEYAAMAEKRIHNDGPMFASVSQAPFVPSKTPERAIQRTYSAHPIDADTVTGTG